MDGRPGEVIMDALVLNATGSGMKCHILRYS